MAQDQSWGVLLQYTLQQVDDDNNNNNGDHLSYGEAYRRQRRHYRIIALRGRFACQTSPPNARVFTTEPYAFPSATV
jgi:hypothetical protein